MSVKRIYVEKKEPFAVAAKELRHEIRGYLGIKTVTKVRELIRYDVENISEDIYRKAVNTILLFNFSFFSLSIIISFLTNAITFVRQPLYAPNNK